MADTSSLVSGWIKSGGQASNPEQAEQAAAGEVMSPATDDSDTVVRAENSETSSLPQDDEDTPKDSSEQDSKAPAKAAKSDKPAQETSQKEVITITDEQGRKRKVEVDYSDREATKKAHLLAAGARKWQAERDQAIQSSKQLTGKYGDLEKNWNSLEGAYQKGGIEGVVDLLEGRSGAFKDHARKVHEREQFIKNATPQELEALKKSEENDLTRKELAKLRKDNEDFKKSVQEERERAELGSVESQVHPVFNKHRFADTLGDADAEHMFDEMLWTTSMGRLEKLETALEVEGKKVTPEMISQEFARTAKAIRSKINVQAEKKATSVVEQKKREATENVQAKVMSGYKSSGNASEASRLINNGDLTSVLKNWGKFGSVFGGSGGKK